MAVTMSSHISQRLNLGSLRTIPELPGYGGFDDFAAMAVLATLTVLYLFNGTLWNKPDPYLYKLYERPQEKLPGLSASKSTRDIGKKLEQTVNIIIILNLYLVH